MSLTDVINKKAFVPLEGDTKAENRTSVKCHTSIITMGTYANLHLEPSVGHQLPLL
jgi:hypothetical protein